MYNTFLWYYKVRGSTKVQVQVHACNNSVIYSRCKHDCIETNPEHLIERRIYQLTGIVVYTKICNTGHYSALCRSLWKTVNSGSMDLNDTKVFYCYMLPCFGVPVPSNKAMKVYSPFNHWAMLVRLLSYFYLQHNIHAHAPKSLNLFSQVIDTQQKCIEYYMTHPQHQYSKTAT